MQTNAVYRAGTHTGIMKQLYAPGGHRKLGQAEVLQTLRNTCQVRIFAVTLIISRKTSHGTPQYLLPNARVVP